MKLFRQILEAMERDEVRYVVVGGLAVVLQGHARFTADIDLAVDLSREEALRAVRTLQSEGLRPRAPVDAEEFADSAARERWIREKGMDVFTFWDPTNPLIVVDLFVRPPIAFGVLWERSDLIEVDGLPVRVASLGHLIEMKRQAGRPQDLEDIRFLRDLVELRRARDKNRE